MTKTKRPRGRPPKTPLTYEGKANSRGFAYRLEPTEEEKLAMSVDAPYADFDEPIVCPPTSTDESDFSTDGLMDVNNPFSFINAVPDKVAEAMRRLPHKWFGLNERELRRLTRPDPTDTRIRYNLWVEFDRFVASNGSEPIVITNVIRGACTGDYFYRRILRDEKKLAWVISPPPDYVSLIREMFERSLAKMSDILDMSPYKVREVVFESKDPNKPSKVVRTKEIDTKLLALQASVWKETQQRVMGAVVQKLAVHQHSTTSEDLPGSVDVDELNRKLALARERLDKFGAIAAIEGTTSRQAEDAILFTEPKDIVEVLPTEGGDDGHKATLTDEGDPEEFAESGSNPAQKTARDS